MRCTVYYRPLQSCIAEMYEFCDIFNVLSNTNNQLLIMGDFNLPHVDWNLYTSMINDLIYDMFLDTIYDLNLFQFVNQATRKDHILDLFLSNYEDNIDTVTVLEPLSDHHLVCIDFQIIVNDSKVASKMIPDHARAFNVFFQNVNWYDLFYEYKNIESRWKIFIDVINEGIEKYIPLMKVQCDKSKCNHKFPNYIRHILLKKKKKWFKYKFKGGMQALDDFKCLRKD